VGPKTWKALLERWAALRRCRWPESSPRYLGRGCALIAALTLRRHQTRILALACSAG
jgi:hypothetical protein